jgi:hypothetical protein
VALGRQPGQPVPRHQGVHDYLTEKGVPHIWRVDTNGHDTGVMSNSLYHFVQKLFKE